MRKKCKCTNFHNVVKTKKDDMWHDQLESLDGYNYQAYCPLCGHVMYINVPDYIHKKQRVDYVKALSRKISGKEKGGDILVFFLNHPLEGK